VQTSALLDPATQYATDVVAGTVIAGRLVRRACARHLQDLQTGAARGLVWRPDEAQRVIDFFPSILRLPERVDADDEMHDDDLQEPDAPQPFVLAPFQQFIAGSLFGWYTNKGRRRFRRAYIEIAKGSGKTPFAVGLMLYRAVADGERNAQVFFAATQLDQAKIPFADAEKMVDSSPSLRKRFVPTVNNLAMPSTGSFLRAISSEKKGLDGKRVSACLLEEVHEHPSGLVVQKMTAGIKGRRNALIVEITNSGFDRNSVCWHHHEYSRKVLAGSVSNEAWFAYVAQLDTCDTCHEAGKLQPSDTCQECDSWRLEGPHWLKANPNLGVSLAWEYLREQVRVAVEMPSEQNIVKRLNFCIWTDQVTVWIPVDRWNLCRSATLSSLVDFRARLAAFRGRECFIGCDLSEKIDLASAQAAFPRPIEQAPDAPARLVRDADRITRAIDVLSFFWMPDETLHQRAAEDNIPYPQWLKEGWLFSTPGALIDHDAIVDFLIQEFTRAGILVRGIGVDQAGATAFVTRLQRHFGDELVTEVPQGFRMLGGPSKTLEALVVSGQIAHDGNPVMAMCIGNMGKEENRWREIRPVKLSQRKRIDGGVALIDAICTMERSPLDIESVYEQRGVLSLGDYL
jgi:phage terminase large subunit-like protein